MKKINSFADRKQTSKNKGHDVSQMPTMRKKSIKRPPGCMCKAISCSLFFLGIIALTIFFIKFNVHDKIKAFLGGNEDPVEDDS